MKKAILIGLIAGITGLAIGYKMQKRQERRLCNDFWQDY